MKKTALLFAFLIGFIFASNAQNKKDGTPDMRYNSNKQTYGSSYASPNMTTPTYNSDSRYQSGYIRDNGTYVQPTYKTNPNSTNLDNYSTQGNSNPYNGNSGTRAKDYSTQSLNYGSGQTIQTGERGGQYYINSSGNKVYVPKR